MDKPPRGRNFPQTSIYFGSRSLTRSFIIILITSSWKSPWFRNENRYNLHNISGYRFSEPSIIPIVSPTERIKRTVINRKTGLILASTVILAEPQREKEILILIRQGFLSKEIAYKLNLSIYTVNNHRKNILAKLNVDNAIEAINKAENFGILYWLRYPIQTTS